MPLSLPRVLLSSIVVGVTLLCGSSCGAGSAAVAKPAAIVPTAATLFPLQAGNAWAYEIQTQEGETVLAVQRVVHADARQAQVSMGRGALRRYEILPEGLRILGSSHWLLREPIKAGAQWSAAAGRVATVSSLDARITTPAAEFRGCVRVEETQTAAKLKITTIYCAGVGPVYVESELALPVSGRTARTVARLRGYQLAP